MSRRTLVIGTIALIFLAMTLIVGRQPYSVSDQPGAESIDPNQTSSPAGTAPEKEPDLTTTTDLVESAGQQPAAPGVQPSEDDLEAELKWLREDTTKNVLITYSLMFRHLGLTESEQQALVEFLTEVWMSRITSRTSMTDDNPEPIGEEDRQVGIASIIGDAKLKQFLILERNRAEYRETWRVSELLQSNDVPLNDVQQDQLLEILVQVRGQEQAVANPDAEPGTIEAIESQMATMDEYERLVLELAPSVLSVTQVELLYERYQAFSIKRADLLEKQKKSRANDTADDDFPLVYPSRN